MSDLLKTIHGIYGGLLYLVCWALLVPVRIAAILLHEGGLSAAKIGALLIDVLEELIQWLERKLL